MIDKAKKAEKRKEFREEFGRALKAYKEERPEISRLKLKIDIYLEHLRRGTWPWEYYRFGFYDKDKKTRDTYVINCERTRNFSYGKWNKFPKDKYGRYKMFDWMYHRDILNVEDESEETEKAYQDFISKHEEFIAKPHEGCKGIGIRKVKREEAPDAGTLMKLVGGGCLIEQMIEQGEELAKIHPQSVNTLRLVTVCGGSENLVTDKDGNKVPKCGVIFAMFRSGRGDSVVDNVGSGGITTTVDITNGIVKSDGTNRGERFPVHPDSGIRFKGFQLPEWNAVCEMAIKAHRTRPDQRLIGWDFAWTKNGWDVVETNPSPSFQNFQVLVGEGMRKRLTDIVGELR